MMAFWWRHGGICVCTQAHNKLGWKQATDRITHLITFLHYTIILLPQNDFPLSSYHVRVTNLDFSERIDKSNRKTMESTKNTHKH